MKKLLLTLLATSVTSAFAMSDVNLNGAHHYTCNGVRITSNTTITTLQNNCHNVKVILHEEPSAPGAVRIPGGGAQMTMIAPVNPNDETMMDKVEFYTDKGSYMKCYYTNNKFVKCKRNPPKTPLTTTKSSASAVQKSISSSAK